MSIKTNFWENEIVNILRNIARAGVTAHVGLISAVTDAEAGTVTEITGANGLTRQPCGFSAPSNGTVQNAALIAFGTYSGGANVTCTHVGIWDAATAGNLLYVIDSADVTINPGNPVEIAAGQLSISEL